MDYWRGVIGKLFGKQLEFRVRLFNILACAGTLISILMLISGFQTHSGVANTILNLATALLSAALLWYSSKSGKYQFCYTVTVVFIFLGMFSALFFISGGYHAGMTSFFVFAVLFTVFMLEGKRMVIISAFELIWYTALCVWAYYHPEQITALATEAALVFDVIMSFLIVAVSLGVTMALHFRLYNQQQKELEAARKQAEEFSRMKSELFADMSHEMRTPLAVMSGYAQYAVEQIRMFGVNDQTLADLATIGDEAKRLAEMADGTLKILMSAGPEDQRDSAAVDISVLTMRLAHLFTAIASRKGRKLTAHIDETLTGVHGDMDALTQLLWNVLQNAIAHSEGDISLIAEKTESDDAIRIIVRDTGAGIPPELLPHIFDRGVSGSENGSGLGLSLCRDIAQRHGGELLIESEQGIGTTVTVILPIIKEAVKNA